MGGRSARVAGEVLRDIGAWLRPVLPLSRLTSHSSALNAWPEASPPSTSDRRRNPNSFQDWTLAYRFFQGKPMRLTPALQDLYQDDAPFVVIQKAA